MENVSNSGTHFLSANMYLVNSPGKCRARNTKINPFTLTTGFDLLVMLCKTIILQIQRKVEFDNNSSL